MKRILVKFTRFRNYHEALFRDRGWKEYSVKVYLRGFLVSEYKATSPYLAKARYEENLEVLKEMYGYDNR